MLISVIFDWHVNSGAQHPFVLQALAAYVLVVQADKGALYTRHLQIYHANSSFYMTYNNDIVFMRLWLFCCFGVKTDLRQ